MPRVPNDVLEKTRAEQLARGPTMVIRVNDKAKFWNGARISYEDIVERIVCEHVGNPKAPHTVTFSYRAKSGKPGGTLEPGQDVEVESRMSFKAEAT